MVTMNQIEELGRRIGREFDADRIVLFGSHARGLATDDSDVDLLIILPFEGKSVIQSVEIRMRLRPALLSLRYLLGILYRIIFVIFTHTC